MNIIDNIKLEEINKITWGILFPSSFCDELKKHLDPQRLSDYLKEGETRVEMQKVREYPKVCVNLQTDVR